MAKHIKTEKQFLLKDLLFNEVKVRRLASEIHAVYPKFQEGEFVKKVISQFPRQELMERIAGIREALREFLPESYTQALAVILQALPKPLDHTKTDNDFGDFIYAPYSYFVATHGCTKENLIISLAGLSEITKRFSAEAALRYFLNAFPDETLREAQRWAKDENYHVRRLASEGTRPNLPWAKKVVIPVAESLKILERLYTDKTRYVTRSVANHLNDLSKTDTSLVVATLRRWQSEGKQSAKELQFITKHALRTAVKRGDREALSLLGYERPQVTVTNLVVKQTRIIVGEALEFSFTVDTLGTLSQALSIDYSIHFRKANGSLSPKVFKLQSRTVTPGEVVLIKKSHMLRPMTTRSLYSGEHVLEVHINGQSFGQAVFHLA